jgi:DNA-directed RNA polymerase beta subunit
MGLNTLVLFHAMYGLVNEDALVVSESYANRMTHYSIIDLSIDIKNSSALKWIAPIGTKVKSKDSIATIFKAVRLDEINRSLNEKLGGLFGEEGKDLTQYTIEDYLRVPNNIDEAYISDVLVQENKGARTPKTAKKPDFTFARESQKVIDEYEKNKDRKIIYDKFPEYVAADTLDPINLDNKTYKVIYTVRIRLIKKTGLMVASKVTNRYGGKGVVSKVMADEKMPIMIDKASGKQYRVEVVI